jgi:hypothetical protein
MKDPYSLSLGLYTHNSKRRRRNTVSPFELHSSQRLRHMLVLGRSGMGKSTALSNFALADIRKGLGCVFIDPHHVDAENLMERIPAWRRKDVIYFNPAEFPVSFNVLDNVPPDCYAMVASFILDTIKTISRIGDAPNVDMFVQASIIALLERGNSTLMGLQFILDTPEYRTQVIRHIQDPIVRHFWEHTFDNMTDRQQRENTLSTVNKIFNLIVDPAMRNLIGQKKSAFDFAEVIAKNKIVIVSVPSGKLSLSKIRVIVGFLLAYFHVAALARPRDSRLPFPLYIQEAHLFINETVIEMLTGLRKFHIPICLSHHSLQQIEDPRLRSTLLTGVETLLCFRLGPDDADELARMFTHIKPDDLTVLEPHRALTNARGRTEWLTMPDIPKRRSEAGAAAIRRNCRHLYGRPLIEIETEIGAFMATLIPKKERKKREESRPPQPPVLTEHPPEGFDG